MKTRGGLNELVKSKYEREKGEGGEGGVGGKKQTKKLKRK